MADEDTKTSVVSTPERVRVTPRTFRALRHRSYRYLWTGGLGHAAAMWMEQVVRPVLILQLTGSALQVGAVIAVRMVPIFFFGLIAGVVADRYDRRRVLMICQSITLLVQLTLGLLLVTGLVQVWHVYATAFIAGSAMAFNQPARQSLIPRLVPGEDLLNAVALNSAAFNVMRVLGASLAGLLLIAFDYGEIYLLNALVYAAVTWTTIQIKIPSDIPSDASFGQRRASLMSDFVAGFRYINSNRQVLFLVGMALIVFVLAHPYQQVFVPLIALKVLGVGRSGVGWMLALTGVGALIAALTVASREHLRHRGMVMMGVIAGLSLALILLSQSHWIPLSAVALILAGGMSTTYMTMNNTLLLEQTPPEFQGRVMSLMSLDRGMISLGALFSGGLAEMLGPQLGLTVVAGICLILAFLSFFLVPVLRRIQ